MKIWKKSASAIKTLNTMVMKTKNNLKHKRYQYLKFCLLEIRNLGVGNFKFSKDEQERQIQMDFFNNLHMEVSVNYLVFVNHK